ncbi:piggyBac transposable element-derived protein 2-like [Belonocnema kinseyi]|uniref:piggyBac transposable element-derived protein 2-like n=1 Tax=Belonocnema kinseyi TaxID=2817044 RepID=UPI00143D7629|nr:piggyBac transposable element-derived protein 2-like [Belonocnema kinseyi]
MWSVTRKEIEQFLGTILFMSLTQKPSTRDYWSSVRPVPGVSEVMSVNRWEEIKRNLHFNDNESFVPAGQVGHDKLHKVRPIVKHISQVMRGLPKEKDLCVDEQIVPFKGSPGLQVHVAKERIISIGTVRQNRLQGCTLKTEKDLKKEGRGAHCERVGIVDGVKLSATAWLDNKMVTFLSSYVGSQPVGEVERYFAAEKTRKMILCPKVVTEYNRTMGGVDKLDSILGLKNPSKYMPLADFKGGVAECLTKAGKSLQKKRGRPSQDVENKFQEKKKRGPVTMIPSMDVHLDQISHYPEWMEIRHRCKNPKCTSLKFVGCEKCKLPLCFNKDRNCFHQFHLE